MEFCRNKRSGIYFIYIEDTPDEKLLLVTPLADIKALDPSLLGSPDEKAARRAIEIIEGLTKEAEVGAVYTGKVTRILNFGAMVEILPKKEGLVHVSELADYRVASVEDVVKIGDEITVKVIEIDNLGRINLSRRAVLDPDSQTQGNRSESRPPRNPREFRPDRNRDQRDRRPH